METTWWYNKFCGDKFIENIVKSRVWRTSRKIQDLFITYTSSRLICGRMRNNWVEKTRHGKMNIVKNQFRIITGNHHRWILTLKYPFYAFHMQAS